MASSIIKRLIPSLNGVPLIGDKTSRDLKIGTTVIDKWGTNTTIPNKTTKEITDTRITLTQGTWIIRAYIRYPHLNMVDKKNVSINNSSGLIHNYGALCDIGPATDGNELAMVVTVHIVTSASEVVFLKGYHSSGASITTSQQRIQAWKL